MMLGDIGWCVMVRDSAEWCAVVYGYVGDACYAVDW